ncbi:hypothetical protein M426DRAFT_6730 [Hypoxylon sp. CI-4A]|nr:hypothetical protein M426DRAFT_6730 [Hypoxylon sp. CI-4A]
MRLLHASRGELVEFIIDDKIPPYAILSHRWEEEEISLHDWKSTPPAQLNNRKGYQKIQKCREQTLRDGLEWVWVDTCCIDKPSSADLSEAINSMFRWYQNSNICYAYLSDVSGGCDMNALDSEFTRSHWFERGWTLQELIAPGVLRFYSKDWEALGDKSELSEILQSITHIQKRYLDSRHLSGASVAKKMSWAANRRTSRTEDIAYCLLGLFDINMPLIYGEGTRAFKRLQEEILRMAPFDHSIFAWGNRVQTQSAEELADNFRSSSEDTSSKESSPLLGLLAPSPREFADSGYVVPDVDTNLAYQINNTVTLPAEDLKCTPGTGRRTPMPR